MGKRFVTYRTEDAKAGLVNVDENGVLKTGNGAPGGGGSNNIAPMIVSTDGLNTFFFVGIEASTWFENIMRDQLVFPIIGDCTGNPQFYPCTLITINPDEDYVAVYSEASDGYIRVNHNGTVVVEYPVD